MRSFALLFVCLCACAQENTYQISGVVVDHSSNHPLNHVLVEIISVGDPGADASVVTEADGRFTFVHVPKGKYNLQAQKRGQFPQGFHSTDGGYATAIVVDGNLKTDNLLFPLRTDSSIGGVVIDDDGEAIRNAQLHLFRESVNDGETQITQLNNSVTRSSGQFHFGHLEAGKYYLAASATPWYEQAETEMVYPITFYGDTTDVLAARVITLTEGASATAQIQLRAVPGIRVKLPNGPQNIMLSVPGPGGTQIPIGTSMISANGTAAELHNLVAGRYLVSGLDGAQGQTSQSVDLTDGNTLSLENKAIPAEVSGRIIFDTPRPQEEVNLFLSGNNGGSMAELVPDGTFKFDKTPAGKFDINLNSASLVIVSMQAKGAQIVHDRLEIPSGAAVDLTIHLQSGEAMAKLADSPFRARGQSREPWSSFFRKT